MIDLSKLFAYKSTSNSLKQIQIRNLMKRLAQLLLCGLVSVASSEAANIAFVSFHADDNVPAAAALAAGFTQAPDAGYTQLLRDNGHTVTRIVTSATPDATVLNAFDVVIISRSVPSGNYQQAASTAAWNGITAPTIVLGGYILRNSRLGYTSGGTMVDTTVPVGLKVFVPGHPVFAGIALDANGKMVNSYANIVSYTNTIQRGVSVNSNPVSGGGVVLAAIGTIGDAAQGGMVIGEWLAGDKMANGAADTLAGHRLVVLTGSREASGLTSEGAGIYDLTADGAAILLNSVNYMTSGRASIATVNTVDNEFPGAGETSLAQALSNLQDGDTVRFQIPGAGPHVITTPMGGYPFITAHSVIIDGYTQDGAMPNTNSILGGNSAQLKIVLDSSGTDTAENPQDPSLPLHRSTRLLYPGFGDTEDAILPVVGARNFRVRGISFVSRYAKDEPDDPNVYCVAFVNVPTAATGGQVSGCWFGLRPDGVSLRGGRASVATFRNGDLYSSGLVIGTDGDGVQDRAEFNIHAAMSLAIHLQVPNVKISGNYVNVLPSGKDFVNVDAVAKEIGTVQDPGNPDASPATVEFLENANCTNVVIGVDGDGVADADERNIVANVSYSETMEFWRAADNVVVAGNYFGVGVDGVTASPVSTNEQPDFVRLSATPSSIRIGSNGDGVSDDLEGNLLVNISGDRFVAPGAGSAGDISEIVVRRNVFRNCAFPALPFADSAADYSIYYADVVADSSAPAPVLLGIANDVLKGRIAAPNAAKYGSVFIDVYVVDDVALANEAGVWPAARVHPSRWFGTFIDNGPGDTDPEPNQFAIDISTMGLAEAGYVTVSATYSTEAGASNAGQSVTSPMSNPIARQPVLVQRTIAVTGFIDAVELSWLAAPESFRPQLNNNVEDATNWTPFETRSVSYEGGRNIVVTAFDPFTEAVFYRLISN